jgi:hypothetical protein
MPRNRWCGSGYARIHRTQQREEQFLRELQTQGSPQYHKFLTADEWNARFAPSAQDEQAVVDWAQSQGLTGAPPSHRMLVVTWRLGRSHRKAHDITINSYRAGSTASLLQRSGPRDSGQPEGHRAIGGRSLNNLEVMHPGRGAKVPVFSARVAGPVIATGATGGHSEQWIKAGARPGWMSRAADRRRNDQRRL